jgi:(p)ppGpp synthase/HD superfamily hydrolase
MNFTPRLEYAIRVATRAHRNQTRKATDLPYIVHPFSVMLIASMDTQDEDTLIACLFHDIIEDVPDEYSETDMEQEFGKNVVEIVRGVTKDASLHSWQEQAEAYLKFLENQAPTESIIVSCSDKIHNLMSTNRDLRSYGKQIFNKFHSTPEQQLWYYRSVLKIAKIRTPDSTLIPQLGQEIEAFAKAIHQKAT